MRMHQQQCVQNTKILAIESSGKHKYSTSFVRLFMQHYKRAKRSLGCLCWTIKWQDKADKQSVTIQSALCEVMCEENSRGLNTAVVKAY